MPEDAAASSNDRSAWGRREWERYLHDLWFRKLRLNERLRKHLEEKGGSRGLYGLLRPAGLNSQTIQAWVQRPLRTLLHQSSSSVKPYAPSGLLLRKLLTAAAIDAAPYASYLAECDRFVEYRDGPKSAQKSGRTIVEVCPECGDRRDISLVHIDHVQHQRREKGLPEFPISEDGAVERPCVECSWDKAREARGKPVPPPNFHGRPGPKSAAHKKAISTAKILGAHLGGTLHLCPLDLQWHHRTPWHRDCVQDYSAYRRRHPEAPPQPLAPARRGPSEALAVRDLQLLLAKDETPEALLRRLETADRPELQIQPRARHGERRQPSRNAAPAARRRFLGRHPGVWNRFYTVSPSGSSRAERMKRYETKLAILDGAVPDLAAEVQRLINAGAKDPIIRRLYAFDVSPDRITTRIGDVEGRRTAQIIARMTAADIERERTRGFQRTGADFVRARGKAARQKVAPRPRPNRRPTNLKLTPDHAQAIIAAPDEWGVNARLARQYNLAPGYVSAIRKGRTVWTRDAASTRCRAVQS